MCPNKPNISPLVLIPKENNKPILIVTNIKHNTIILYCISHLIIGNHLIWCLIHCLFKLAMPSSERPLGVWVFLPERL